MARDEYLRFADKTANFHSIVNKDPDVAPQMTVMRRQGCALATGRAMQSHR